MAAAHLSHLAVYDLFISSFAGDWLFTAGDCLYISFDPELYILTASTILAEEMLPTRYCSFLAVFGMFEEDRVAFPWYKGIRFGVFGFIAYMDSAEASLLETVSSPAIEDMGSRGEGSLVRN